MHHLEWGPGVLGDSIARDSGNLEGNWYVQQVCARNILSLPGAKIH